MNSEPPQSEPPSRRAEPANHAGNGRGATIRRLMLPVVAVIAMGLGVVWTGITIEAYRDVRARDNAVVAFHDAIILHLTHLKDAETGTRGFALVGEDRFLEPLRLAEAAIPAQVAALRKGIESTGADRDETEALVGIGQSRLALSRELVSAARSGAGDEAIRDFVRRGKALMDEVRRRSGELEEWAVARHREHEAEKDALLERSNRDIGLLALSGIALTVAIFVASQSDLRARRREAHALARFRAAIDASPDEVYLLDRRTMRFVDANEGAAERTGYSRGELLGMGPQDITPLARTEMERILDRIAASPERRGMNTTKRVRKDGSTYPVEVLIRALGEEHEAERFVAVSRDTSEREDAERQREQAWRAAELASSSKSEFLSRMSHELRTPLNSILGYAQLMETPRLDDDDRDSLRHILKAGRHLLALINEVLDITRIEAGRLAISPEVVPLREVVEETLQMIRPMADARRISVSAPAPAEPIYVRADRQRIKQVLVNLVNNAIKFNRDGGSVRIEAEGVAATNEASPAFARIKVVDDGPGIPREFQGRLFQAFERMGADRADVEGTGLGLAVSSRLVELMNGRIGVESEPGEGATFWIEIPRAERVDAPEAEGAIPVNPSAGSASAKEALHRILQIEDNPDNRRLVQKILERERGLALVTAATGQDGLEIAAATPPDLVVLDLHLPDIDGSEVLTRLRAMPGLRDVPIVILSADATPGQIRRLRALGADEYLTKPLEIEGFLSTIRRLLESGRLPE